MIGIGICMIIIMVICLLIQQGVYEAEKDLKNIADKLDIIEKYIMGGPKKGE
jgi:TM2 domain-containing membrane protein YozV